MKPLIKNIEHSKIVELKNVVEVKPGEVISRTLAQDEHLTLTLFAFAKGEGLSMHTAPGDALVQILEGGARITIGDEDHNLSQGQAIVMPADVPHALHATEDFKMLLTLVKR